MPKYIINSEEKSFDRQMTLSGLCAELGLAPKGLAIAVNNNIVPKTEWETFNLKENDNVVIIRAACGG